MIVINLFSDKKNSKKLKKSKIPLFFVSDPRLISPQQPVRTSYLTKKYTEKKNNEKNDHKMYLLFTLLLFLSI